MKNVLHFAFVAVLTFLPAVTFGQTVFSRVALPVGSADSLTAINNSGQIVANTATTNSNDVSLWNRLTGNDDLGLTPTNSVGAAINGSGDVVGAGYPTNSGPLQAFLWRTGAGAQWLGTLGGSISEALGINNAGAVVGMSFTAANTQHAFLWTQTGGMVDLTPSLTSNGGATATGINSSNQVVGYYYPNGSNSPVGFIWTQSGGLQNLGSAGTQAFAINDAGTVVGQFLTTGGFKHAFSWTQGGGMQDLGTLGGSTSSALGINNQGWIVGTSSTATKVLHAFLWTATNGMRDFTSLAGLGGTWETYSLQVNDVGVTAISTNQSVAMITPKMIVTVTSSVNPCIVGQPVTFTANITSIAGPPPDGEQLKFLGVGKIAYGTVTSGVAQITTSFSKAGSYTISGKYLGDANYLPAKSPAITQVVNP